MKYSTVRFYETNPAFHRFDISRHGQRFAGKLFTAWLRLRRWREAQRAIRHLRGLDEYLLVDVGIRREDIARAVNGSER